MPAADTLLRVSYKAYSSAVITPGVEPVITADPGASGGQQLRRVSSSINFKKSTFKSNEIRPDRQVFDFRHGGKRVTGEVVGELSPLTYQDFFTALFGSTWIASISKDQTVFTNIAITSGVATVGASTWAAQGFRNGDIVQFTGLSVTANNGPNFALSNISGTTATLTPSPLDQTTDTSFTVATKGRKTQAITSGFVSYKYAFEHYYADVDLAHVYTECRIVSMKIGMPAEGIATINVGVMGRNRTRFNAAASPFFTAPTAPTTTGLLTSIGGQLLLAGVSQAVVTSAELTIDLSGSAQSAAFTPLVPEIYLGDIDVSGSLTLLFNDDAANALWDNETEFELLLMLAVSGVAGADYISFYMPRVKMTGGDMANAGKAGVPITFPFQALLKPTTTGYDNTTITVQDSLSA